jgi:hypothetical protein
MQLNVINYIIYLNVNEVPRIDHTKLYLKCFFVLLKYYFNVLLSHNIPKYTPLGFLQIKKHHKRCSIGSLIAHNNQTRYRL